MHPRQHQHLSGTARKRRLHARLLKIAGRIVQTGVILGTVAVAGAAVMAMVAQKRPLPVGPWIERVAGDRLQDRLAAQGLSAVIGDFDVMLRPGLVPVAELRGLALYRRGESEPLVSLASATLVIDRGSLLCAELLPRALRLDGLTAVLAVSGGGVRLGADRATILEAVQKPGEALAQLGTILDRPVFSELSEIGISGIDLRVEDRVNGWAWHNRDGDLRIGRQGSALALGLRLAGPGDGDAPGTLALTVSADMRQGTGQLRFAARGLSPAQLLPGEGSGLAAAAEPLADLPVSLDLAADLRADGSLAPLRGRVVLGDGTVRLGKAGVAEVEGGGADLVLDLDSSMLMVDRLRFDSDRLSLSGALRLTPEVTPSGAVSAVTAQASLEGLALDMPGLLAAPVEAPHVEAGLRYDFADRALELGPSWLVLPEAALRVTGGLEWRDPAHCTRPAEPSRKLLPDCMRLQLDAAADVLDLATVEALWPPSVSPPTRKWAMENVHDGEVTAARLSLRMGDTGKPDTALTFHFDGTALTADQGVPDLAAASGFFSLQDHGLAVALDRAEMTAPDGGTVAVGPGRLGKSDTSDKSAPLLVAGHAEASAGSALSMLSLPRLTGGTTATLPMAPEEVSGAVTLDLALEVPMGPDRAERKLDFSATGRIADAATSALVKGREVATPGLDLALDREAVTISGPATLDGFPAQVAWSRPLGQGAVASELRFEAPLNAELLAHIGLPVTGREVTGTGRATGQVELAPGQPAALSLTADLGGMGLSLPSLGWSKSAGRAASLSLAGRLGPAPSFDRLSIDAPGLAGEGRLALAEGGGLSELAFSRLRFGGWLDSGLTLRPGGGGKVALSLSGGSVDLAGLPRGRGGGSGGAAAGPVTLEGMRIRASQKLALEGASGTVDLAGGVSGQVTGRVNGGTPVQVALTAASPGPRIRVRSADAGHALRDAGFFAKASGGTLDLTLDPTGATGSYRGDLEIEGLTVTDAPAAASILSAISVVGLAEQAGEGGLFFGQVDAEFLLTPERVVVSQAAATGPSLGLSIDGALDLERKTMNMQGVISPFYFVNRVGAGMTRRGEGLVGITFTMTGPFDAPKVRANPLSILAPGVFRELFRREPPKIGETK
ncbi:AsmA-like C-terminal region-containing protein [Poseidonocella sp. HB161398]|uniref:AsmA-like C-terminal region-containing protein n=1 Tax=Poseidonocella sp. HB161398 TaxID=2320855 RepID=UPI0011099504|nr:AsmA-like C-terminal region-containing protein [Poseidonocella sp. HB161398]